MSAYHRNRGFSLIELMIALVAGLIVSYAVLAFTMSSMKNNGEFVQSTQLTQELRNTLDLSMRELRRAGYDENALAYMGGGNASPFNPMLISGASTDSSCVIYAYDKSPGGTPGTVDPGNGEVRALRRVVVGGVGIVEYGVSSGTTRPLCNADTSAGYASYPAACTGVWCPLSDPRRINVTAFRITNNTQTAGTGSAQVRIRELSVELRGRRVGDDGTNYLGGVDTTYERKVVSSTKIRSECARTVIAQCDVSP